MHWQSWAWEAAGSSGPDWWWEQMVRAPIHGSLRICAPVAGAMGRCMLLHEAFLLCCRVHTMLLRQAGVQQHIGTYIGPSFVWTMRARGRACMWSCNVAKLP